MAIQVCMGAMMQCSFGAAPSTLVVLPTPMVLTTTPSANITAFAPVVNIPPFGMCNSPSNPMVISLTAAALGVFTPAPCIPVTTGPWIPGAPTVMIANMPALDSNSKLMCAWAGVIQIVNPGQTSDMVP